MLGRSKKATKDSSTRIPPRAEYREMQASAWERIVLESSASLVASGHYGSLDEVVEAGVVRDLTHQDTKYRVRLVVTRKEAAVYDDGTKLEKARAALEKAVNLSDEEAVQEIQKHYDEEVARHQEYVAEKRQAIMRLKVVLEQAKRWELPPDEKELVDFRRQFITELENEIAQQEIWAEQPLSERYCRPSVTEYRDQQIGNCRRLVEELESDAPYAAYRKAEAAKREAWVKMLHQSLESSHLSE